MDQIGRNHPAETPFPTSAQVKGVTTLACVTVMVARVVARVALLGCRKDGLGPAGLLGASTVKLLIWRASMDSLSCNYY